MSESAKKIDEESDEEKASARALTAALLEAIVRKDGLETIEALLAQGARADRREPGVEAEDTALPLAAISGSMECFERLLKEFDSSEPGLVASQRELLWAALVRASFEEERVAMILPRLALKGRQLTVSEERDALGAMRMAASCGDEAVLSLLMDHLPPVKSVPSADTDYEVISDHLGVAAAWGSLACAKAILSHPVHGPAMTPERVFNATRDAMTRGSGVHLEMLQALLPRSWVRRPGGVVGETALASAAAAERVECVEWLLTSSPASYTSVEIKVALGRANASGSEKCARYLDGFLDMERERAVLETAACAPRLKKRPGAPRM